ncbi:MAG TPA: isoprenylcysteine carboxylmethyltransferase family protein [Acetobacteraceae bacterium]|nr:isoprenylcysteine carboxylmethyltransferase family protein [Acetobacteraceae bacterium]
MQSAAAIIIDCAWVSWAVTWFVLARDVKQTVRRESRVSRLLHLVPLFVAALLLFGQWHVGWLGHVVLSRAAWMAPVGAGLVLAGLLFSLWARLTIGRNWSGTVTVKQAHALVDTGPYRLARHPIYTGLLLAFLGTAVAIDEVRGWLAFALVAAAFLRKMRTEEAFMVETFGSEYESYRTRVKSLVPFVW